MFAHFIKNSLLYISTLALYIYAVQSVLPPSRNLNLNILCGSLVRPKPRKQFLLYNECERSVTVVYLGTDFFFNLIFLCFDFN